jgi:cytochrome c peroxidase
LWQHPPYFHDGSAKDLADVVDHYNRALSLKLGGDQRKDLVEYLKSL